MQTEKMVLDTDPKRGVVERFSVQETPQRGAVERFSLRETPEEGVVERFSLQETPQRCGCRDNLDSPLWKTPQMGLFRPHLSVYFDGCGCFGAVRESAFWLQRILVRPNSEETPTQHSGKTGTTNHGASRLKPWTCPVPASLRKESWAQWIFCHGAQGGGTKSPPRRRRGVAASATRGDEYGDSSSTNGTP